MQAFKNLRTEKTKLLANNIYNQALYRLRQSLFKGKRAFSSTNLERSSTDFYIY